MKYLHTISRVGPLLGLAAILGACSGTGKPEVGFQSALPPAPVAQRVAASDGAIFRINEGFSGYHEGTRARKVGDALTILLVESTTTTKSATGNTKRSGSASITPPTAGLLSFLNPNALNAGAGGSFSGKGNAGQTSSLNGVVAVTIAEVRPNGTALVHGEKLMTLSQGREWVQFSGIIRLADVDVDNRVLSWQVADSQIIYSGAGAVQQASKPGWLSRFFAVVSPF